MNHVIWTVLHAVAASNAGVFNEYFTVRAAVDCIGRTFVHAIRLHTMAARSRYMDRGKSRSSFTVQSGSSSVGIGAGFLTVITTDADRFVD